MKDTINLEMGDWLFNAGLVGLINILEFSGDPVRINEQEVQLDVNSFENFEDKYFNYLIEKYKVYLSWYKIVSYEDTIKYHEDNNFETITLEDINKLNKYIKDCVKYYVNSASYKAAYQVIKMDFDILDFIKEIETIKLKSNEKIKDRVEEIKTIFNKLKIIIEFCKTPEGKKYLAGKNVIYSIIKHSWDGVCFLNSQTKEKDMYVDYRKYFIEPAICFAENEEENYKFNCFTCNAEMKDLKNDVSFLNNIGFDVSRKSSHVWNFSNDIAICPICKLVYSCVPAGITYVYDKGIYVNENTRLKSAVNINNRIRTEIFKEYETTTKIPYRGLINAINQQSIEKVKYELADIQVVKYKEGVYRFNILSSHMLSIISSSKDDLNGLVNSGFREIKTYFNIYELVIERILNSQNLFTLIHKLLVFSLSNPSDCRFGVNHLIKVLNINLRIMEGMGYMEKSDKDIIKLANISGYYLREGYKEKGAKDKLNGISYRFLNALKTNNKNMFMDTLLNCYLYTQKTVPTIFLEALKDDNQYKTIGYAFVTGLFEGKDNSNKNGGPQNAE